MDKSNRPKKQIDNKKINAKADSIGWQIGSRLEKVRDSLQSKMVEFESFRSKFEMNEFNEEQLATHLKFLTELKFELYNLEKKFNSLGPRLNMRAYVNS